MSIPTDPDGESMRADFPENNDSLSSSSTGKASPNSPQSPSADHGELYQTPINNGSKNDSDSTTPQDPHSPSTVPAPNPQTQISHITNDRDNTASSHDDETGSLLDDSSTFQESFFRLKPVWQSAEASVSRLSAALEKREGGEMGGGTGRRDNGSPDRYFVIDEATRVERYEAERDEEARAKARENRRERSSNAEDVPTMRREGTKEGYRSRRFEELREGVLEQEGKL